VIIYWVDIASRVVIDSVYDKIRILLMLPHSMPSRVYGTVGRQSVRPSVRLSHRSTAVTAVGGFAAERSVCRRYRSIAACVGAVLQQMRVASSRASAHRGKWGQLTPSKNE